MDGRAYHSVAINAKSKYVKMQRRTISAARTFPRRAKIWCIIFRHQPRLFSMPPWRCPWNGFGRRVRASWAIALTQDNQIIISRKYVAWNDGTDAEKFTPYTSNYDRWKLYAMATYISRLRLLHFVGRMKMAEASTSDKLAVEMPCWVRKPWVAMALASSSRDIVCRARRYAGGSSGIVADKGVENRPAKIYEIEIRQCQ